MHSPEDEKKLNEALGFKLKSKTMIDISPIGTFTLIIAAHRINDDAPVLVAKNALRGLVRKYDEALPTSFVDLHAQVRPGLLLEIEKQTVNLADKIQNYDDKKCASLIDDQRHAWTKKQAWITAGLALLGIVVGAYGTWLTVKPDPACHPGTASPTVPAATPAPAATPKPFATPAPEFTPVKMPGSPVM